MANHAFDWSDYFKLASELATRPEERCLRTAISRAYYYVYHLARKRVLDNRFHVIPGGDSHKQVWEKFDASPEPDCKKLYSLALRLKDKRQQADYNATYPRIQDEFPAILELTKEFADRLAKLNPSSLW
jgi:uncharacterized protein (UPF0332 family)